LYLERLPGAIGPANGRVCLRFTDEGTDLVPETRVLSFPMLTADVALLVARSNSSKAMGSVARVLASVAIVRQNEFRNHLRASMTGPSCDATVEHGPVATSGNHASGAPAASRPDGDDASSS
jgi:hypothetical protein